MQAKKLRNQSVLEVLQRKGPVSSRMRLALGLLDSNSPTERDEGFRSIERSEDMLKFAAVLSHHSETRLTAVKKLSTLKALAFVVDTSDYFDVKHFATERLNLLIEMSHPDLLREAAEDAEYGFLRTAAVLQLQKMGESGQLAYVSLASRYEDTKQLAQSIVRARRRVSQ